jgi:DNA-binding MarR family transcriptional regulator
MSSNEGIMGSVAYSNLAHVSALSAVESISNCSLTPLTQGRERGEQMQPSRTVRAVQAVRRQRAALFGGDLFSDPAWDILLELYALHLEQQRTSVSSVYKASTVPGSTALRWLAKLEHDGLVVRTEDPLDQRRSWIDLTDDGRERMRRLFEMLPFAALSV